MSKQKVYYAHCVAIYGSAQEQRDINTLETLGLEILNPNTSETQERCIAWKSKPAFETEGRDAMFEDIFYPMVEECEIFAFRGLPNGRIPGGVYKELLHAVKTGKTIFELPSTIGTRGMSREETVEFLKEIGNR